MSQDTTLCEASALYVMLNDPDSREYGAEVLTANDFTTPLKKKLFAILSTDEKCDLPILFAKVEENEQGELLDVAGSDGYSSFFGNYCESLKKATKLRDAKAVLQEALKNVDAGEDDTVADAIKSLEAIEAGGQSVVSPVGEYIFDVLGMIGEKTEYGVDCGFPKINRATGGLRPGTLMVIGGRASMGKSALGMNMAVSACRRGASVIFFSLEDDKDAVLRRMMSMVSGVSAQELEQNIRERGTEPYGAEIAKLTEAAGEISKWKLHVDDTPGMTVNDILKKARDWERTNGCDVVIVDYLQCMKIAESKNTPRYQAIGEVTRSLKAFAKKRHLCVVLMAQLNRNAARDDRDDPMLSDFRESGDIEQDADVVIFPVREDYGKKTDQEMCENARLIIAKNRNGRVGEVQAIYQRPITKFLQVQEDGR